MSYSLRWRGMVRANGHDPRKVWTKAERRLLGRVFKPSLTREPYRVVVAEHKGMSLCYFGEPGDDPAHNWYVLEREGPYLCYHVQTGPHSFEYHTTASLPGLCRCVEGELLDWLQVVLDYLNSGVGSSKRAEFRDEDDGSASIRCPRGCFDEQYKLKRKDLQALARKIQEALQ